MAVFQILEIATHREKCWNREELLKRPMNSNCFDASRAGSKIYAGGLRAYFAEAGHAFRMKPDRCFARSWTVGAQRRRGFCFYSDCWFSVKLIFSFRIDSPFMLIR